MQLIDGILVKWATISNEWETGLGGGRTDGPNPFSQLSCQAICWTAALLLLLFWWRSLPASPIYSPYPLHTLRWCRWRPAGGTFLTCCSTSFEKKELAVAARKLVCFRLHDCQPNDDGLYIVTPACMHSGECNIFFSPQIQCINYHCLAGNRITENKMIS